MSRCGSDIDLGCNARFYSCCRLPTHHRRLVAVLQMLPAVYRWLGASWGASPTQLGVITLCRALVQALSSPLGGIAGAPSVGWPRGGLARCSVRSSPAKSFCLPGINAELAAPLHCCRPLRAPWPRAGRRLPAVVGLHSGVHRLQLPGRRRGGVGGQRTRVGARASLGAEPGGCWLGHGVLLKLAGTAAAALPFRGALPPCLPPRVPANTVVQVADMHEPGERGRAFGLLYATAAMGGMLGALYATNLGGWVSMGAVVGCVAMAHGTQEGECRGALAAPPSSTPPTTSHSLVRAPAGAHAPLGMQGWRFAFLSLALVSAATGAANLLLTVDPQRQGQQLSLPRHQDSLSLLQQEQALQQLSTLAVAGVPAGAEPEEGAAGERQTLLPASREVSGSLVPADGSRSKPDVPGQWPGEAAAAPPSMSAGARQVAGEVGHVLRTPTFAIIVVQASTHLAWDSLI